MLVTADASCLTCSSSEVKFGCMAV